MIVSNRRKYFFWLFWFVVFLSIKIFVSLIGTSFFSITSSNSVIGSMSNKVIVFFVSIVIAPIFETAIFFSLLFYLCIYFRKNAHIKQYIFYIYILLSALLFSLNHSFSWFYIIITFISGIMYATIYYKAYAKRYSPFKGVVLIHSLYNLFVFIWNNWF